jgi:hypothetical protein
MGTPVTFDNPYDFTPPDGADVFQPSFHDSLQLAGKPVVKSVAVPGGDPTNAHLQRYADEVASGRTPPPDLIATLKAAGITDPATEAKRRGIVGRVVEDSTAKAHLERYKTLKASGQPIPPDLIAALRAAGIDPEAPGAPVSLASTSEPPPPSKDKPKGGPKGKSSEKELNAASFLIDTSASFW